jgi:NAD(P)H dehydrogenase (quinone)
MLAITGATGQLGQATLRHLTTTVGASQLVALVRDPQKATGLVAPCVTLRQGNYNDPASLVTAFQGVSTVLLISGTDLDTRAQQHRHVIDAARAAGVTRLVYTSGVNPAVDSAFIASPSHAATEDYLRASGLTYTILRNTLYLDLLPMLLDPGARARGAFYYAAGEGAASFALRAEIAEVLATVLTTSGHDNQTYDIAPAPVQTMAEVTAAISAATGQPLRYVPISGDELTAALRQHHLPEPLVLLIASMAQAQAQQEFNLTSPAFAQLLGRQPTSLAEFVQNAFGR